MRTPLLCSVSQTRSRENTSMARSRALWPRTSAATSSALSTAKRICPECSRSASRIAFSMASRLAGRNARRAAPGRTNRCRATRARSMSPAPRCATAAEAAAAAAETTAAAESATAEAAGKTAVIAVTAPPAEQREHERNHSREERERHRADEQPRQRADESARDRAADEPAEHRAQQASRDQREDEQDRQRLSSAASRCRAPVRRRQGLAVDDAHHRVHAGVDATVEIAVAKARRDDVAHDALGGGVVEHALQSVAHLDAQRPVILRHDKQGAVVDLLATQLPALDDAQRVLLDRLGRRARHHQHRDLSALAQFELPELALERRLLLAAQRPGLVHDLPRERWHGLLCPRRGR